MTTANTEITEFKSEHCYFLFLKISSQLCGEFKTFYSGCQKNVAGIRTFFSTTTYAAFP